MQTCDIVIPVWNNLRLTADCVDSIAKNTSCPYRLIIIDNASDKETAEYLEGLKAEAPARIMVVRNSSNLGFVKAVNQGIKASSAPYICIMNNDTLATKGWLEEMMAVMQSNQKIGILNPSSNTFGDIPPSNVSIEDYALGLDLLKGRVQELYACRGFCMLMRREAVERIGLFDEIYDLGYFEETDFSKRAERLGFGIARAMGAYVYHKEHATFDKLEDTRRLFKRNEEIFFKKWGRPVKVGYFVDNLNSKRRIDEIAAQTARTGHQMLIFLKKGLEWPITIDHYEIRRFDMNNFFFGIASIYKVLKRKRKKKIDILLTDNRLLGAVLKSIKGLTEAEVLINPDREALFSLIRAGSKRF